MGKQLGSPSVAQAIAAGRRRDRRHRQDALKAWLLERRDVLTRRFEEIGAPPNDPRGISVSFEYLSDLALDPFGGGDGPPLLSIGRGEYATWRLETEAAGDVGGRQLDNPQIYEADWLAAELSVITWALDTVRNRLADPQHMFTLGRLLTACQVNRLFPSRRAEVWGEGISRTKNPHGTERERLVRSAVDAFIARGKTKNAAFKHLESNAKFQGDLADLCRPGCWCGRGDKSTKRLRLRGIAAIYDGKKTLT